MHTGRNGADNATNDKNTAPSHSKRVEPSRSVNRSEQDNGELLLQDLECEDFVPPWDYHQYKNSPDVKPLERHKKGSRTGLDTNLDDKRDSQYIAGRNLLMVVDNQYKEDSPYQNGRRRRRQTNSVSPSNLLLAGNNSTSPTVYLNGDEDLQAGSNYGYSQPDGHGSSMSSSVNNAITNAPSRTTLFEPNVYAGGRPHHLHHKKHHHRKHKGRSKSPGQSVNGQGEAESILNKIDNSILKNFGDWTNMDSEESFHRSRGIDRTNGMGSRNNHNQHQRAINTTNIYNTNGNNYSNNLVHGHNNGRCNGFVGASNANGHATYFIPKFGNNNGTNQFRELDIIDGVIQGECSDSELISLPRLYKSYDNVVNTSTKVLTDKSLRIAISKDNNDPNSILSEAKRTLTQYGNNSNGNIVANG